MRSSGKVMAHDFSRKQIHFEKILASVFELTKIGSCAKFAINIILKNRSNSSSRFPLTDKFH